VTEERSMAWELACPSCRVALPPAEGDLRRCARCGASFRREEGIWRFLSAREGEISQEFVDRYERVRKSEGRRVQEADDLRALPFAVPPGGRPNEWFMRSRSFEALLRRIVVPLERASPAPLRVLDLGSGLGWLAYRLALRGHEVAAVDLVVNDFDGLGVHRHYDRAFVSVQAEFDRLPLRDATVDLVVYNAAFHYAADYLATLEEALRVLTPGGRIVVMDTPIYKDRASGRSMVREREQAFEKEYGLPASAIRNEGFLTYGALEALGHRFSLLWELVEPWYGVRWWLKPPIARLLGRREPARFKLIIGQRR
jgi:SAM-dependent methyltransferase